MKLKIRPIFDTLKELRHGRYLDEASEKLTQLIAAIRLTRKGGELILKIKVEPLKGGDAGKVIIRGIATVKLPEPEPAADLMYTTEYDNLSTRNPFQRDLELKIAGEESQAPIDVDTETGELLNRA